VEKGKIILGAGITGLSAGLSAGNEIYEAGTIAGGICTSYYMDPAGKKSYTPHSQEVYRFEIGGGHWIFGADQQILEFIRPLAEIKTYERKSAVYFPDKDIYVPYPLQNHLSYLPKQVAEKAADEIINAKEIEISTFYDWLLASFGKTLCELFFFPFHELYTAGLYKTIAPQDKFKTPANKDLIMKGLKEKTPAVGYNAVFAYPRNGLNELIGKMSAKCKINHGKRAVMINPEKKEVVFEDSGKIAYDRIFSTLPLNRMLDMAGIKINAFEGPHTSVLVLNIGAKKGKKCPDAQWLYIPQSRSGFHRVGFYSNVDPSFVPESRRKTNDRVSIYVEKAFLSGEKPDDAKIKKISSEIVEELKVWGFISEAEVADPTWIETAYTWEQPDSAWKEKGIAALDEIGIRQIGRYGKWKFQGIAESIKDGLNAA
jgi:protoporphyrinogen oxidase